MIQTLIEGVMVFGAITIIGVMSVALHILIMSLLMQMAFDN